MDKRDWRSQACNKGLLLPEAADLLLVQRGAMDRRDWRSQACNKGLLLPDRSLSDLKFHKNSSIQNTISLCLEKLYQSNFTAAKSSYGLSRLFVY